MTVTSTHLRRLYAVALLAACALPATAAARATSLQAAPAGRLVSGVVRAIDATAAPQTLTLARRDGSTITVDVGAATTVLRLYKGTASIADVGVGDYVSAWGTSAADGSTTVEARYVRDWSIQLAYTLMAGRVESAGSGATTVRIFWRMAKHSPFWRGELLSLTFDSAASITSGPALARAADAQPATADDVQPSAFVWAWGLYDSATRTLRVRQLRIITAGQ